MSIVQKFWFGEEFKIAFFCVLCDLPLVQSSDRTRLWANISFISITPMADPRNAIRLWSNELWIQTILQSGYLNLSFNSNIICLW